MLSRGCRAPRIHANGFTLVELAVVIGILMILAGILAPALAGARETARLTRAVENSRSLAAILVLYANTNRDLYPISTPGDAVRSAHRWQSAAREAGLLPEAQPSDDPQSPDWFDMSLCMVYDAALMRPGATIPIPDPAHSRPGDPPVLLPTSPVRQSQVAYPSGKGLLFTSTLPYYLPERRWCCLPDSPRGPVAFVDGSAAAFRWTELLPGGAFRPENGIGVPVYSTWGGCLGRDR